MQKNHKLTQFWQSRAIRQARHFASPRRWYRYLTADWRPLPRFIIAGAQKAGTTSLFGYLAGHPNCLRGLTKEVNFFDQNFARGERWYRMHFPLGQGDERSAARVPAPSGAFCLEASPHYMFEPEVAARVRTLLPEMKAIFLLRNPADRAYSHYQHEVRRGRETRPFEDCIAAETQSGGGPYLSRGVYVDQLRNWRVHFPAEQMLVIEAERMFKQPAEVLRESLDFLGIEPWAPAQFGNLNPGRYSTPMTVIARDRATRFFAPHNEQLARFVGKRYSWC